MTNALRRVCFGGTLFLSLGLLPALASAQAVSEHPGLDKQLGRIDLALLGIGQFTNQTDGINNQKTTQPGEPLHTRPSNDFNGMGQIRYTASQWFGLEFNYVHGRNSFNFTTTVPQNGPNNTVVQTPYFIGVETNADEYTLGYVIHPHPTKYLKPFVSLAVGTTDFAPTAGGGNQNKPQGRLTMVAGAGVDAPFTPNFGMRAEFRGAFNKHPDFEITTYRDLTWNRTLEPVVGFYLRF